MKQMMLVLALSASSLTAGEFAAAARAVPLVDLTGDRHQGVQLADGRLCIVFRDMAPESPAKGSFVGWVGSYEELKSGAIGDSFRIKLLHNYAGNDCGYPGIHLLEDGTVLATTYVKYWNDSRKQSVVCKRFKVPSAKSMAPRRL